MGKSNYGEPTIALIRDLQSQGINRFSVILRHSARYYDQDIQMEPFMSLTDEGRDMAYRLGEQLPEGMSARFFSSYIGRCIETAYLIDKGYVKNNGGKTKHNIVTNTIAPFYVLDLQKLIEIMVKQETFIFIRNWIDGYIPETIMLNAKEAANSMFSYILQRFNEIPENAIDIFVSHDWNMYLLKELGVGLAHEQFGKIEYLEGLVFFMKDQTMFIAHHQTQPQRFVMPSSSDRQ